jgi:hypothetical protein
MPSETSYSFSNLPWSSRRHYIGALLQTDPPKIAVYSLTGNESSPFHAEPAHDLNQHMTSTDRLVLEVDSSRLVGYSSPTFRRSLNPTPNIESEK